MGFFTTLKAAITNIITTNNDNLIQGSNLHDLLQEMTNQLGAYENRGLIAPGAAVPVIDRAIYWTSTAGTYIGFNSIEVLPGEICYFKKVNGETWTKFVVATVSVTGADMTKAIYDTNDDGIVDQAALAAVANALSGSGFDKYWGTDNNGVQGFYDFTPPTPQVQSDWNVTDVNDVRYINNKPTIPDIAGLDNFDSYANLAAFPTTGDPDVIYVAIDTKKTYGWFSTEYVVLGADTTGNVQLADQHRVYMRTSSGNYNAGDPFGNVGSVPTAPTTGVNKLIVLYNDGIAYFEIVSSAWTVSGVKLWGSGDMTKSIYDTNDNGKVDVAELADLATNATNATNATSANTATTITGLDSAGNSKYHGTDENGNVGFFDLPSGGGGANYKNFVDDFGGVVGGDSTAAFNSLTGGTTPMIIFFPPGTYNYGSLSGGSLVNKILIGIDVTFNDTVDGGNQFILDNSSMNGFTFTGNTQSTDVVQMTDGRCEVINCNFSNTFSNSGNSIEIKSGCDVARIIDTTVDGSRVIEVSSGFNGDIFLKNVNTRDTSSIFRGLRMNNSVGGRLIIENCDMEIDKRFELNSSTTDGWELHLIGSRFTNEIHFGTGSVYVTNCELPNITFVSQPNQAVFIGSQIGSVNCSSHTFNLQIVGCRKSVGYATTNDTNATITEAGNIQLV